MKIKIAYQEHERRQAENTVELLKNALSSGGAVKETRSDRHEPFLHVYLSAKCSEKSVHEK